MKNNRSSIYAYPAIFTPEKEGGFYIHFPDIDNCFTCGNTIEEGLMMAKDALALMVYTNYEERGSWIISSSIYAKEDVNKYPKAIRSVLEYLKFHDFTAMETGVYKIQGKGLMHN